MKGAQSPASPARPVIGQPALQKTIDFLICPDNLANMTSFTNFLFVPGNRVDRIEKALACDADLVCIDLEDSVPSGEKDATRVSAIEAIERFASRRLALRINALTTRAGLADLLALTAAPVKPALLFLPMVQSAAEPEQVTAILGDETPGLIPLVETVRGLRNADSIGAAPDVCAMMFGGGDFSAELGVKLEWAPLLAARSALVMSCAINRIPAIDVPFIDLADEAGLEAETRAAKALGFTAKAAIHPRQIDAIATVMRPGEAEISESREAIAAFETAGGRAIAFRGRMLEEPVMHRYRCILQAADTRSE